MALSPGWYRYLYAQELKDRAEGHMVMHDAWCGFDEARTADWTRKGDIFYF